MKLIINILIVIVLVSSSKSFAMVQSAACDQIEESQIKVTKQMAIERTRWAARCYKRVNVYLNDEGFVYLKNSSTGKRKLAYPFFYQVNEDFEQVDQLAAPFDEGAPCWDPDHFVVGGFCEAYIPPPPKKVNIPTFHYCDNRGFRSHRLQCAIP